MLKNCWPYDEPVRMADGNLITGGQDKEGPPRFSGKAKGKQGSYPYGYEHDGKLFVVYSIGKEDCGLSVLPIESLKR